MTIMVKRNLLSGLVLVASILVGVLVYAYIFKKYDKVWFDFYPVLFLSIGTFLCGIGIYISAILLEYNVIKRD